MDSYAVVREGYPSYAHAWRQYVMPHYRATLTGRRGNYYMKRIDAAGAVVITPSGAEKRLGFHAFQAVYNLLLAKGDDVTRSTACAVGARGCFDEICLLLVYVPFIQFSEKPTPRLHLLPPSTRR